MPDGLHSVYNTKLNEDLTVHHHHHFIITFFLQSSYRCHIHLSSLSSLFHCIHNSRPQQLCCSLQFCNTLSKSGIHLLQATHFLFLVHQPMFARLARPLRRHVVFASPLQVLSTSVDSIGHAERLPLAGIVVRVVSRKE